MLTEFIKNGEFNVSEREWKQINERYSKEDIKNQIIREMMIKDPVLPYLKISSLEAEEDFRKLTRVKVSDVIVESEWNTRYDYEFERKNILLKSLNVGNKSSNFFHQQNRWKTNSINSPSPERVWNNAKFLDTLLNGLWTLKITSLTSDTIRTLISLRKYIASQFRPSAAKVLYDHFEAKKILDFSSGWGDRLNGFLASNTGVSYFGLDPNEKLADGYDKQIQRFDNGSKFVSMNVGQAEEYHYNQSFDFVFTSPPYYDIERYTYDESQSWVKYKVFEDWLENFLFRSIKNSWDSLDENGTLAINISDVYCHHRVNKICDPMNKFIDTLKNSEYQGCWGLEMKKRPNSKSDKSGKFAEPIWIWKKKKNESN